MKAGPFFLTRRRCGGRGRCARRAQRGLSLFVVLIMLLLSALLAVGAARVAQLLESVAGNVVDHQRAFEAAEAALLDAERDIRGLAFDAVSQTYVRCTALAVSPCRAAPAARLMPDPDRGATAYVDEGLNSCKQGICYFDEEASVMAALGSEAYQFWTKDNYSGEFARYGQFTGAPTAGSAPLAGAKYWVEVIFRRQGAAPLYRVTAVAQGARSAAPGGATRVMLQMSIDPEPVRNVK